jgi:hypothetical protein
VDDSQAAASRFDSLRTTVKAHAIKALRGAAIFQFACDNPTSVVQFKALWG